MQAPEKIAPVETQIETKPRRFEWNADLLYKLDGAGIFGDARIELIEGEVIEMSPIGPRHAAVTAKVTTTLVRIFALGYVVFPQNPVRLSSRSVPQPDVMVLRGTFADYLDTLPETAVLMVEVADSTLASDRRDKTSLYARYNIQELWIVNVADEELEIYRQPRRDNSATHGFSYGLRQVLGREAAVSSLEMPEVSIPVADLLV
jgi:Uma2 family endonuclease